MNIKCLRYIACALISLLIQSCDVYDQVLENLEQKSEDQSLVNVKLGTPEFSNEYRNFSVDVKLGQAVDFYLPDMDGMSLTFFEYVEELPKLFSITQPVCINKVNCLRERVSKSDKQIYILVDRTLPQEDLEFVESFVRRSISYFSNNIYVSFIGGHSQNSFVEYQDKRDLENFIHSEDKRSILTAVYNAVKELQPRADEDLELVVFSDGSAYQGDINETIDPTHLVVENSLLDLIYEKSVKLPKVTYINFPQYEGELEQEAAILLRQLVKKSGGSYFANKSEFPLSYAISFALDDEEPDYRFEFENPNGKKYAGLMNILRLDYRINNKPVFYGKTKYRVGNIYNPIIVGGVPLWINLIYYTIIFLIFFLLVYLVTFILLPYVFYKSWYKKNVVEYRGTNMTADGNVVAEHCCYCKDTFKEGDKVVVNCQHHMHLECWDANSYKCTEHGYHSHESEYYYNKKNLFDPKNAPFYMNWILGGVIAGYISYIMYVLTTRLNDRLLVAFLKWMFNLDLTKDVDLAFISVYAGSMFNMPEFGAWLFFGFVMYIGLMTDWDVLKWKYVKRCLLKALFCAVISYIIFFVYALVLALLKISVFNFWLDWIPFVVSGIVVYYLNKKRGQIIPKKKRMIGFAVSALLALFLLYMWIVISVTYHTLSLHLLACMTFIAGTGYTLAIKRRHSSNYYLHVSGQIKEMDIAIHKLLRTNEKAFITLGRSVDCDIQINWDTEHPIQPVMAKIKKTGDGVKLLAEEPGVISLDKELALKVWTPLSHGDKFCIGSTTFQYIEKDL